MITKIELTNFKGITVSYDLAPITIIASEANGSGKTAILDAATVALVGYHPRLGKQTSSTFQLSSGDRMEVTAWLSNGEKISAMWRKRKNGTIESERNGPDLISANRLNLAEFRSLKAKDRQAYVAGLAVATFDKAAIREDICQLVCQIPALDMRSKWLEMYDQFAEGAEGQELSGTEWIDGLIQASEQGLKDARKVLDTGKAQLETARSELGPEPQRADDTEIHRLRSRIAAVDADADRFEESKERNIDISRKIDELRNMCSNPSDWWETVEQVSDRIAKLELMHAELGACPEAYQSTHFVEATARLDSDEEKLANLREKRHRMIEAAEKLADQKCCPTCKSEGDGWRKAFAADMKARDFEIQSEITLVEQSAKEWREKKNREKQNLYKSAELVSAWVLKEGDIRVRLQNACKVLEMMRLREERIARINELEAQLIKTEMVIPDLSEDRATLRRMEELQTAHVRWSLVKERNDKMEEEQRKGESIFVWCKSVCNLLIGLRKKVSETSLNGVLVRAREITRHVFGFKLDLNDGDFGYWDDDRFVPLDTLSGAESRVVEIAIQYAFAMNSRESILMLDELGILSEEIQVRLFSRICKLVEENRLGQFLCSLLIRDENETKDLERFVKELGSAKLILV